jgi:hypothetical protein
MRLLTIKIQFFEIVIQYYHLFSLLLLILTSPLNPSHLVHPPISIPRSPLSENLCADKWARDLILTAPPEDEALRSYVQRHGSGSNWIALPDIRHGSFTEEVADILERKR